MVFSVSRMARSARRAQFGVVNADGLASRGKRTKSNQASTMKAVIVADSSVSNFPDTEFVVLFRDVLEALEEIVEHSDLSDEANFFHAMRFLQMLGLGSDDVVKKLKYRQEHICRWMNGTRRPHAAMRSYVVKQCLQILKDKVGNGTPPSFGSKKEQTPTLE